MEAEGIVILILGLMAFVAGWAYLTRLVRDAREEWPLVATTLALLTVCAAALVTTNPQVWPLFVLSYPSCACVLIEAELRL